MTAIAEAIDKPKPKRRALLVGTFNRDTLIDGALKTDSLGGLVYSLLALRRLFPEVDVELLSNAGEDLQLELSEVLAAEKLHARHVRWCREPNNAVELDCGDPESKTERSQLTLPSIQMDQLNGLPVVDGLLMNFTSGQEMDLETWQQLRDTVRGLNHEQRTWIQMDLHSLTLDAESPRRPRKLPNWEKWIEGVDLLQLTLYESWALDNRVRHSLEDASELAHRILKLGVRVVVVTHGAHGFLVAHQDETRHWPAEEVFPVVDTTGCGDVLGAAFFGGRLHGWGLGTCARLAQRASAAIVGKAGLKCMQALLRLRS